MNTVVSLCGHEFAEGQSRPNAHYIGLVEVQRFGSRNPLIVAGKYPNAGVCEVLSTASTVPRPAMFD